jgi:hypothetical protein
MKKLMLNIFIVGLLISLSNCQYPQNSKQDTGKENVLVYKLDIEKKDSLAIDSIQIEKALKVLNKRVNSFTKNSNSVSFDKSTSQFIIKIKIKEAQSSLANFKLLLKPCKISFYECYAESEFHSFLSNNKSQKISEQEQIFLASIEEQKLSMGYFEIPYLTVGRFINIEDFNNLKNGLQNFYSNQFLFAYETKIAEIKTTETKKEPLKLYALKNNESKIEEVNKYIENVKVNLDDRGFSALGLSFNQEGAQLFANLTSKNQGKFIAITIDNEVFMAPKVNGEIKGGKLQISGRFEPKELENLKFLIECGYLPFQLKIASENFEK